jgi:hypothetical protein
MRDGPVLSQPSSMATAMRSALFASLRITTRQMMSTDYLQRVRCDTYQHIQSYLTNTITSSNWACFFPCCDRRSDTPDCTRDVNDNLALTQFNSMDEFLCDLGKARDVRLQGFCQIRAEKGEGRIPAAGILAISMLVRNA